MGGVATGILTGLRTSSVPQGMAMAAVFALSSVIVEVTGSLTNDGVVVEDGVERSRFYPYPRSDGR